MTAKENRIIKFEVTGRGGFPFDMLRYDQCFPADTTSAYNMAGYNDDKGPRTVTLIRRGTYPTVARWASFGWACSIGEIVR